MKRFGFLVVITAFMLAGCGGGGSGLVNQSDQERIRNQIQGFLQDARHGYRNPARYSRNYLNDGVTYADLFGRRGRDSLGLETEQRITIEPIVIDGDFARATVAMDQVLGFQDEAVGIDITFLESLRFDYYLHREGGTWLFYGNQQDPKEHISR